MVKQWLSEKFARWAFKLSPTKAYQIVSSPVKWVGGLAPRYQVEREMNSQRWYLYDGPDGSEAKRRYEYVIRNRERGTMSFNVTTAEGTVTRGTYQRLV